jgi:hypothetical protein
MKFIQNNRETLAFLAGLALALIAGWYYTSTREHEHGPDDYHIHADVVMMINGVQLDLSDKQYMSGSNQVLHDDVHLHDEEDGLIHVHAENISLGEFYGSLGLTLEGSCLTTTASITYCTNENDSLLLFINGIATTTIAEYIPSDGDQLLLYYGKPDAPEITEYLKSITDVACIYSGTCPERGTPPPESCGLTCEI